MAAQMRERLGLLDREALDEARLTRTIFSGSDYLARIDSSVPGESARLPSP